MSTRSIIARAMSDGWEGRYCHFDGYPSGVGAALYQAYHGYFERDLKRMLEYLIDEHPAGWSVLCGVDFTLPAGFQEHGYTLGGPQRPQPPECYCHGDRAEPQNDLRTHDQEPGHREEYLYVMSPANGGVSRNRLLVFDTHYRQDILIGEVDLDDEEPDWNMEVTDDHPALVAYHAEMRAKYPSWYV